MKKISVLIISLLLFGCNKEQKDEGKILPKGIYLKRLINNSSSYSEFYYNTSGQFVKRQMYWQNQVQYTWLFESMADRVTVAYFTNEDDYSGSYYVHFKDGKLAMAQRALLGGTKIPGFIHNEFFYYDKNKLTHSIIKGSKRLFEFDSVGNITRIKYFTPLDNTPSQVHTIEYDKKKNPFYLFDPAILLQPFYIPYTSPTFDYLLYLCPNNFTRIYSTYSYTDPTELEWTYNYNSYDYPTDRFFAKAPAHAGQQDTLHYEYQIVE